MKKKWEVDRRHFLRGMGYSLGLPLLNAMLPGVARSQVVKPPKIFMGVWGNGLPRARTGNSAVLYAKYFTDAFLNGSPRDFGNYFKANTKASAHLKQYLSTFGATDKDLDKSQIGEQGHQPAWLAVMSSASVRDHKGYIARGDGQGYKLMNETFDQRIARHYKLQSFAAQMEPCSKHVHLAQPTLNFKAREIVENLSWTIDKPGLVKPVQAHLDPRDLYLKLVNASGQPGGGVNKVLQKTLALKKDVLSAVLDDIKSLNKKLGSEDKVKMEEFYDSMNDLDRETASAIVSTNNTTGPKCTAPGEDPGTGYGIETYFRNGSYMKKHLLFQDLMLKAYQCDIIQVFSFANSQTGNNLIIPEVADGARYAAQKKWHVCSHYWELHGNPNNANLVKDEQRRIYGDYALLQMELYRGFLEKLASTKQADGTNLLDDMLTILTTDFGYGHVPSSCPLLVGGTAGGRIAKHNGKAFATKGGQRVNYLGNMQPIGNDQTKYNDVLYTFLNKLGIDDKNFGDAPTKKLIAGF